MADATSMVNDGTGAAGPPGVAGRSGRCGDAALSLPVLGTPGAAGSAGRRRPRSRMGVWRAAVLILVHVLIALHVVLWVVSGLADGEPRTLSPLEPSESMATLETGLVNAGFVLFALAVASTAILGRFFCGWACHVVALQDLCGWIMKKCGVHPVPFRSRLLLWVPLGLATYMFVWPTFRREVLAPALERWWGGVPAWIGESRPLAGFKTEFWVEDFWATFPEWYVVVPFLLICGFAVVYFLGSKGFCTYGCPYGGFFGPADRVAPVRIRVTDACNHCGHCTAVCTSNVRVSEEVRDYGAVVDPGCMKCMDCVSACPNDALYVGLGAPAVLTRPRADASPAARARSRASRRYDLTIREEIVALAVFLLMMRGFRGMYDLVPLLMAVGMAAIGTYMVMKSWRVLRDANVRAPYWQLRRAGRVTPAGWAFLAATAMVVALAGQGLMIWYHSWQGTLAAGQVRVRLTEVFRPGYVPGGEDLAHARRAIGHLERAGPIARGGVALAQSVTNEVTLTYMYVAAARWDEGEAAARRVLERRGSNSVLPVLSDLLRRRGLPPDQVRAEIGRWLQRWPALEPARAEVVREWVGEGPSGVNDALEAYRAVLEARPGDVRAVAAGVRLAIESGRPALAADWAQRGLAHRPRAHTLQALRGAALLILGRRAEADEALDRAIALVPMAKRPADAAVEVARVLMNVERFERAFTLLGEALERGPAGRTLLYEHARAGVVLARHRERLGAERAAVVSPLEASAASLERLVAMFPEEPEPSQRLATVLRMLGRVPEAVRVETALREVLDRRRSSVAPVEPHQHSPLLPESGRTNQP